MVDGGLALLPLEDVELRRIMRLVTVSPTGVGVTTTVRRAWAAAALERPVVVSRSRAKALVAARDAGVLGLAGTRRGCIGEDVEISIASRREGSKHLQDSTLAVASCQT